MAGKKIIKGTCRYCGKRILRDAGGDWVHEFNQMYICFEYSKAGTMAWPVEAGLLGLWAEVRQSGK